jgi:uncharacterized membrane protein
MELLNNLSLAIGIAGVVVMVWGTLVAIFNFLRFEYSVLIKRDKVKPKAQTSLRQNLGAYILLSLEFMIAGDIIHTVLKPTQEALIVLGAVVIIRTIISYFLNKELGLF